MISKQNIIHFRIYEICFFVCVFTIYPFRAWIMHLEVSVEEVIDCQRWTRMFPAIIYRKKKKKTKDVHIILLLLFSFLNNAEVSDFVAWTVSLQLLTKFKQAGKG